MKIYKGNSFVKNMERITLVLWNRVTANSSAYSEWKRTNPYHYKSVAIYVIVGEYMLSLCFWLCKVGTSAQVTGAKQQDMSQSVPCDQELQSLLRTQAPSAPAGGPQEYRRRQAIATSRWPRVQLVSEPPVCVMVLRYVSVVLSCRWAKAAMPWLAHGSRRPVRGTLTPHRHSHLHSLTSFFGSLIQFIKTMIMLYLLISRRDGLLYFRK